jgi:hypothetical protein
MIENPPTTAFVSGNGPCELVPSVATMVACWKVEGWSLCA